MADCLRTASARFRCGANALVFVLAVVAVAHSVAQEGWVHEAVDRWLSDDVRAGWCGAGVNEKEWRDSWCVWSRCEKKYWNNFVNFALDICCVTVNVVGFTWNSVDTVSIQRTSCNRFAISLNTDSNTRVRIHALINIQNNIIALIISTLYLKTA